MWNALTNALTFEVREATEDELRELENASAAREAVESPDPPRPHVVGGSSPRAGDGGAATAEPVLIDIDLDSDHGDTSINAIPKALDGALLGNVQPETAMNAVPTASAPLEAHDNDASTRIIAIDDYTLAQLAHPSAETDALVAKLLGVQAAASIPSYQGYAESSVHRSLEKQQVGMEMCRAETQALQRELLHSTHDLAACREENRELHARMRDLQAKLEAERQRQFTRQQETESLQAQLDLKRVECGMLRAMQSAPRVFSKELALECQAIGARLGARPLSEARADFGPVADRLALLATQLSQERARGQSLDLDRDVWRNLVVTFVERGCRRDALEVLSGVMGFDRTQRQRVGLERVRPAVSGKFSDKLADFVRDEIS